MARIAGIDLPKNKHMDRALTYIHGIGLTSARRILDKVDLPYTMNSDDLDGDDVNRIVSAGSGRAGVSSTKK